MGHAVSGRATSTMRSNSDSAPLATSRHIHASPMHTHASYTKAHRRPWEHGLVISVGCPHWNMVCRWCFWEIPWEVFRGWVGELGA